MSKATPVAAPVAATVTVAGVTREAPKLTAASNSVPMPDRSAKRGSKSAYDFSSLTAVGMSIGVLNKGLKQVNPIVHRENRRNSTEIADLNNPGKLIKSYSARYEAFAVDPKTDPDGAQVRIFKVE